MLGFLIGVTSKIAIDSITAGVGLGISMYTCVKNSTGNAIRQRKKK